MKVILQQDVKGLGKQGQLVEASDGYVRNFLLPRKLAVEATASNLNTMKQQEAARKHKAETEKAAALEDAARLSKRSAALMCRRTKLFWRTPSKRSAPSR